MANITVKKGFIGATDISWGSSTFTRQKSDGTYMNVNQVYAASIPIADAGTHYTSDYVEYALGEAATSIKNLSASHTSANTSQAATINNLVKYWWKNPGVVRSTSVTRVIFPAGYYPIGGKTYYSSNTIGWSTVRGAGIGTFNLGMDWSNATINTDSRPVSDWGYLYGVPPRHSSSSTPSIICSGSAPTSKYDTSTIGNGYGGTNTYLGAINFTSASLVKSFTQAGNVNRVIGYTQSATTHVDSFTLVTLSGPETISIGIFNGFFQTDGGTGGYSIYSADGSTEHRRSMLKVSVGADWHGPDEEFTMPLIASTPLIVYHLSSSNNIDSISNIRLCGWYDKYC